MLSDSNQFAQGYEDIISNDCLGVTSGIVSENFFSFSVSESAIDSRHFLQDELNRESNDCLEAADEIFCDSTL